MNPLVSIILPTYNGEQYLAETIESCIQQSYEQWELWIVYDQSVDNTIEIIQKYVEQDDRIHACANERGNRLPGALNSGFEHASGDYFTWISDDNLFHINALATFVDLLQNNQTVDFFYSDYQLIDHNGTEIDSYTVSTPDQFVQGKHYLQSFIYRRKVWDIVGLYAEGLFLAEDFDYWLRIYASGCKMMQVHETLYSYRRHQNSLSDQHKESVYPVVEKVLHRYLQYRNPISKIEKGTVYLYLTSIASWENRKDKALLYVIIAAIYTPRLAIRKIFEFVSKPTKIIE